MNNVILIGMPGAGKSTVGIVLAKVLGYHFIDTDLIIQEKEQRLLHEIITEEGVEGFIEIENRINSQVIAKKTVIATGGSAIYGQEAMEHFRSIGTIVYIKVSCEELKNRLGDLEERGVVLKQGQDLDNLYLERSPLYEKYAHITVEADTPLIEKLVKNIKRCLQIESL